MNFYAQLAIAASALSVLAAGHAYAQGPNIIVIIADDAGWADFGFQDAVTGGTTVIPTPNLDALAAGGVTFSNAYTASVCSPSRAMITTGMYGGRFGYESNIASGSGQIGTQPTQGLPTSITTVWEHMQAAGYSTAAVGKWHIGAHTNNTSTGQLGNRPQNQGVESFEGIIAGSRGYFVGGATGTQELRSTISDGAGGNVSDVSLENQFSGQYITDVFGQLSVDYIADNHDSGQPFFLYSSFTAPHTPLQATAADLNDPRLAGLTGNRLTQAAMQLALDRNVGRIMDALDDPTGDGNQSDSIADNTLVVFLNDNGGDCCDSSPNASRNGPLRNGKGSQFEGGLRIPFIISGAGVDPSAVGTVYDAPIHAIDIVPTVVGAASGSFGPGETIDGVNLLPYINGDVQGVPHEALYLRRANNNQSAVRVGDWKLIYRGVDGFFSLYNLATDIGETNNVAAQNPEIVAQLQRVMTDFDVQMDKARFDNRATNTNQFDEFRFRGDAFPVASWSAAGAWNNNQQLSTVATLAEGDGYANAVLVFQSRAAGAFTATNDLTRVGGLEFMANQIRLIGSDGPVTGGGVSTIGGRGVLLTKSLSGELPVLRLDAMQAGPHSQGFDIALDISLYDDLTITGDGDQSFAITGNLTEYRPGRSVTKTGSAAVSFGGEISLSGTLDIQAGLAEFTDGRVRGDLQARSGAVIRVGGQGIVPGTGNTGPPPPIVTTGLQLNFDAALDTSGDAVWGDAAGGEDPLSFAGPASSSPVDTATFPSLTSAYAIPVSGGAIGLNQYFEQASQRSQRDATFEVVFNVTDTSAGADQVLLEVGGMDRGVALVLNNGQLTFNVDGSQSDINLTTTLAAGWHHAIGVIDLDGGGDSVMLYVNNQLVGSLTGQTIADWAGGNIAGLGDGANSVTGVSSGTGAAYHGEIAIARYYESTAFGAAQVDQNFQALLFEPGDPGSPAVTLAIDGGFLLEAGARLELDLRTTESFDRVSATGDATLAGELSVEASPGFAATAGDVYQVIAAEAVAGVFDAVALPSLGGGLMWQVEYAADSVSLVVTVAGDYNGDGAVDGADYAVWRGALGQAVSPLTGADGNGDGQVTADDLDVWLENFGVVTPAASVGSVPEPACCTLLVLAGVVAAGCRQPPSK
ncbi:MAG: sulfatase-like hydrolase/transferase [Planctomycetota bacterium]